MSSPTVVLVHGAFSDSSSWNEVIARLDEDGIPVIAVATPLRSLAHDAEYVRGIIDSLGRPTVLVGHSYGGMIITQIGAHENVQGLVYAGAFAPDLGESAGELSIAFPGSTLCRHISRRAIPGGAEILIHRDAFIEQYAADVPRSLASAMSVTQRPITERAIFDRLTGVAPAWRTRPSWFVYGDEDRSIPSGLLSFMAKRADPVQRRVLCGGSHAVPVSQPDAVADVILSALAV
ncbi:alpha/beta fold hydrolase [Microbacterium sp.]|uniref:alpha/beta fold hydrolase n=1 Tax=Microbacterium sp. TaxID=51671 RepID=UPI003F6F227F